MAFERVDWWVMGKDNINASMMICKFREYRTNSNMCMYSLYICKGDFFQFYFHTGFLAYHMSKYA